MKNKIAIVGVGYTAQGKIEGRTAVSFHCEAIRNALADAGIEDTTLVWHPGGHFDQPDARMIAGLAWLLKKL